MPIRILGGAFLVTLEDENSRHEGQIARARVEGGERIPDASH